MLSISTLKRTAVTALLAASLGVASAANGGLHLARRGRGGVAPQFTFHVHLTGAQEVPPVKTHASGDGTLDVYSDGAITGTITTHGIHGTMAHIHEGAPNTNGPVIIPLAAGAHNRWVVPQGSKLTPSQYKAFLAGHLYVNVHSRARPGGEIRAQLSPTARRSRGM